MTTQSIPDFIEGTEALHWIAEGKLVNAESVKKRFTVERLEQWGTHWPDALLQWLEHIVDGTPLVDESWPESGRVQYGELADALLEQHNTTNFELLDKLRKELGKQEERNRKLDEAERELFQAARAGKIEIRGLPVARGTNADGAADFVAVPVEIFVKPVSIHLATNKLTYDYGAPLEATANWNTEYSNLRIRFDDLKRLWPRHDKDRRRK